VSGINSKETAHGCCLVRESLNPSPSLQQLKFLRFSYFFLINLVNYKQNVIFKLQSEMLKKPLKKWYITLNYNYTTFRDWPIQ
jgi:hypothetical protein